MRVVFVMRRPKVSWVLIAFVCLIFAVTVFSMPSCKAEGNTAGDTLMVGVPTDRCPVFYVDEDSGKITGIGVDLMRTAAEASGYNVIFKAIKEDSLKKALDNPEYDVIMPFGSAISSNAGKKTVISDNLFQTPFTLVTIDNRSTTILNNLRVGMLKSQAGVAETVSGRFPGIEIFLYETTEDCVAALRRGEVEALLHNSYVWSYVLQKPAFSKLTVQPAAVVSMDFKVGANDTAEGRAIIERLNEGISRITDAKRQAIILDHTTRKLYKYTVFDYLYKYGIYIIMGAILIIFVIVIVALSICWIKVEHEEKMRKLIDQDPLTGLLSMSGFRKRVEEILRDNQDVPYFLSYTNIRDFKFINDKLGMDAGDELLKFWASRSAEQLSDNEAMARIEADHFAVLRRIAGNEKINYDKERVIDPTREYFIRQGKDIRVQICSGLYALMPEDYKYPNVDQMLDKARVAEKKAREIQKDGYEFYNQAQWERGKWASEVIAYFPKALQAGELQVWYQPQVDYKSGKIFGAEALCRWNHSQLGWIPPSDFIPVLEDAGLIYDLDRYVWDKVCQDVQRWNKEGKNRSVSVNVSRLDLQADNDIPGHFYNLMKKYEISPQQLRIEITETAFVEDSEVLIATTARLRKYGFQVEMDDFGSGYSSLNMMKEVVVDRIKLDLRFLTGDGDYERGKIVINFIVQLANALGMKVLAEGVETLKQADFLMGLGCTEMQGYFFYKPMPVRDLERIEEKRNEKQA